MKLLLDPFCDCIEILRPWASLDPIDLDNLSPDSVIVVSYFMLLDKLTRIREIAENNEALVVFWQIVEGSSVVYTQCEPIRDLILSKKIILVTGGEIEPAYPNLIYEDLYGLYYRKLKNNTQMLDLAKSRSDEIFSKTAKPYKFLFFNGQPRSHRKYLVERFSQNNLLEHSIWSFNSGGQADDPADLYYDGVNISRKIQQPHRLDPYYEILPDVLADNIDCVQAWINPQPYIDTYFSLITETVFDYPYSFRTEKLWKPIIMGHPFVVAANCGYYKSLRNQGYKTFNGLIDESFDLIENNQDRIEKLAKVIENLCQENLIEFLSAARDICKYNQQHYTEKAQKDIQEFPGRFKQFIAPYINE